MNILTISHIINEDIRSNNGLIYEAKRIPQDPWKAYKYAHEVINGRWPEAEEIISKNPQYAYYYAYDVIKGRWSEAEEIISKDPQYAYHYAYDVIKGRWPEAEEIISKDLWTAVNYAFNVIKGRWKELEDLYLEPTKPTKVGEYLPDTDIWKEEDNNNIRDYINHFGITNVKQKQIKHSHQ